MTNTFSGNLRATKVLLAGFFCLFAVSTNGYAQSDWRNAYEVWKDTYEAAVEILRLANIADELGNHEVAQNHRNSALGNLEEKALNFLREDIPVNKCGDYANALFDIGAVVAELLPDDTEKLFCRRVLEILDTCSFGMIHQSIPEILWGSRWQIKLEDREENMPNFPGYHKLIAVEGLFKVPECLFLSEILGTKEELDESIRDIGRDATYAWIKGDVLLMCGTLKIKNDSLDGTYKYWKDPSQWTGEQGRWKYHNYCTGCPVLSVYNRYDLTAMIGNSGYYLIFDLASYQKITGVKETCTKTVIDTSDGRVVTDTSTGECDYEPPRGYDSGYWDKKTVTLRNGTYIVDKYEIYRETKITLRCIDNCQ